MNPSEILSTLKSNERGLHLLSIEGRGICGSTALITLKALLRQYQYVQKLPQLPRPCDIFDLAGGTGTGGLIVIMLFRLRMTVEDAIKAYARLSEDVFCKRPIISLSKRTNSASRLENAVAKIVHSSLNIEESQAYRVCMLYDEGPKCFVSALTGKNLSSPTRFRTYIPPRHASYNCTIVEAIRATTAEEPFFPSIDIGDANVKETFVHGGSRINNPTKAVLAEARSIFPGQHISCVLSIGSGSDGVTSFEATSTTEGLKKFINDGESISDEVAKELSDNDAFYCRLNVDHGLEDIGFEDWKKLGVVNTHTRKYLERYEVIEKVDRLVEMLSRHAVIAATVEEALIALSKYLDSFMPGQSWSRVVSNFLQNVKPSKPATETLNMRCALLQDTLESCTHEKKFAELSELKGNIERLLEGLKKMFQDAPAKEDPMTYLDANIQKLLQRFWVQNHIAGNIMVHDILTYIQKDDTLRKTFTRLEQHGMNQMLGTLDLAPFAAYNSSEVSEKVSCFKGTRVRLLNEIANWIAADDPSLAPIYVLDGVAGIGKSTIAKTIAEHTAGINALGASFFFSRNDDKRKTAKTFFPTIAYQLAYYNKDFADQINSALLQTPHIVTQPPHKQFSTLVMEPLKELLAVVGNPIVIVIDALDECGHDGDALLKILADSIRDMPRLKLFITTRPERHIRTVLDRYHHLKRFHLQDIETSVVQSDIRLYLDFHLSEDQVRDKLLELKCIWNPTETEMKMLIGICGTLFIIASTAVKFILDSKELDPARQLSRLLTGVSPENFSGSKYVTAMDAVFTQILLAAVPDMETESWFRRYQTVVGTIVALQHPLPCRTLSALLDIDSDDVIRALSHLYSLVAPGQDLTFRIHHRSFSDFVTSSRCKPKFLIDLTTRHLELGKRCLKIMDSHLKPNICNLGTIDRLRDNRDIRHLMDDSISKVLIYSSTHWATHLSNASELDGEAEHLLEQFAHNHILAWLEVLSFIGQVDTAYSSLDRIGTLLDKSNRTAGITREIFHDGCRFIALNIRIIKAAAGHVFSALAFGPRDTRLFRAYGGKDTNLKVVAGYDKKWDPTISVMTEHTKSVTDVTFCRDGTKLASASDDGTVRLWDSQTGAEIAVLRGHANGVNSGEMDLVEKAVNSVVFSRDGTKLASGSDDNTARLWDGQTGSEIAVLRGHSRCVKSVAFSPDGTKLASASLDKTARLWNGQTGAEISVLQGHSDSVQSVLFSPDGTKLASASDDKTVRLWDGQTGGGIAILRGHLYSVRMVVFSPDGTKLASASRDRTVRLWESQTGAEITVLGDHSDSVWSVSFSPDSTKLASASFAEVRLWDAQTYTVLAVLRGHLDWVNSVDFSTDGTKVASASYDETVRLWDVQTRAQLAVFKGHWLWVTSVVFSPDGTKLASASGDKTLRLWDVQTGPQVTGPEGHWVTSLVFSPDGTKLASVSDDMTVRLWDGQTGAELAVIEGHSLLVNSIAFSPDGTKLASASDDETIQLWDGLTGAEVAILEGHSDIVISVVFSSDGAKLASSSGDGTVRLWDSQTGIELAILEGHSDWVTSVVFSPDGKAVASASDDGTVRLWDSQIGTQLAILGVQSDFVTSLVFSPDGLKLASASYDGVVRLWDSQTGRQIASSFGTQCVAFTLDAMSGTLVYSAVEGVPVPGSNLWVILVNRKQPLLPGLIVVKVDNGVLSFISLCWFPPNLPVVRLAVSSASRVAIGCVDGRILLLDIDFSSLL